MHVRWDDPAHATPHGRVVFFAEFLDTAGVFGRWVDACPLRYSSPNGSSARDVRGTLMLGMLAAAKTAKIKRLIERQFSRLQSMWHRLAGAHSGIPGARPGAAGA